MTTGNIAPSYNKDMQVINNRLYELERRLTPKQTNLEAPRTDKPSCQMSASVALLPQSTGGNINFNTVDWESPPDAFKDGSQNLFLTVNGIWTVGAQCTIARASGAVIGPAKLTVWYDSPQDGGGFFVVGDTATFTGSGFMQFSLNACTDLRVTKATSPWQDYGNIYASISWPAGASGEFSVVHGTNVASDPVGGPSLFAHLVTPLGSR